MKKTYQIERNLVVAAHSTKTFNFQLKETYANCTGFFITPATAGNGANFSDLSLGLNIAQQEILPLNTDAVLFALTPYISREDATYDFSEEKIPARSADVQLIVENTGDTEQYFTAYFILKN